jgi:hypothetical protein
MLEESSDSSGAACVSVLPHVPNAEVDTFLLPNHPGQPYFIHQDPMLQEAELMQNSSAGMMLTPKQVVGKPLLSNQVAP